jgi:exopolysaccharide production protein ExoZ
MTYYNVQVLRACAALYVVWAHLREMFPAIQYDRAIPTGLAGVDLFFVISGFIMTASSAKAADSPLSFLRKRIIRVVPLYYVLTLFVFALSAVFPVLLKSTSPDTVELVKSLLFIPFFKSPDRIYPVYYLGWTLNYEMFFYLIFSVGLFFSGPRRFVFVSAVIGILFLVGLLLGNAANDNPLAYAYTRPIMLDFLLGIGIGLCANHLSGLASRAPAIAYGALVLGAALFIAGFDVVSLSTSTAVIAPPTDTFFRYGLWAGVIVAACVALEGSGRIVKNNFLVLIGAASYSLYLTHFFFIESAIFIVDQLKLSPIMRIPFAIGAVAIVISGAILCYRLLELPMHEWLRRHQVRRVQTS